MTLARGLACLAIAGCAHASAPAPAPAPVTLGTEQRFPGRTDPEVVAIDRMFGDHPPDCLRALEAGLTGTIRLTRDAADSPAVIAIGALPRDVVERCAVEIPESTDVPVALTRDTAAPALTALVLGGGPDPSFWIGFAPSGRFVVHRERARVVALLPLLDSLH